MSDGYPTAAQKEALRLICAHEPMSAHRLADALVAARGPSTNLGYAPAITRMAGTLTWRLQAQGLITETRGGGWAATAEGRALITCPA
ncbi:hypothetical protein ACFY19_21135 [Streptosporangium saharense]|uniref:hypothetical protein n=1 Tax=Streptosporangium saharense TaxID=1706840 RepID=UPI0036756DC5